MFDWKKYTLEELADDITVGFVGSMASEYIERGIPFLRSLNVEPLRINQNDIKYISPEFHRRIKKSRLTPGDVVIVRTGKPGACAVVPAWLSDANCSDLVIVRCGSRINNHFLAYYINTVSSGHVASHIVGAVQQHFNVGAARTLPVYLPPLGEQRAIVETLAAFDDKIELNRQMNETLETMARAIFKDWFVDFGPTRAKMAGSKPYLAPEIWKLFPDSLDDEGKPYGWSYDRLGNITELSWGDTNTTKSSYVKSGYPAYSASGPDGFMSHADFDRKGIVLSAIGANCGQTWFASGKWSCIKNTIRIWSNNQYMSDEYLYLATHGSDFWPKRGSAQPFISQTDARNCVVLNPCKEIGIVFGNITAPIYEKIRENKKENMALSETRDLLLPKLMSGEIRLRDAALTAEAVLEKAS